MVSASGKIAKTNTSLLESPLEHRENPVDNKIRFRYLDVRLLLLFYIFWAVAVSNTQLTFLHNPLGEKRVLINSIGGGWVTGRSNLILSKPEVT